MEQHLQFLRCLEISFHILDAKQPPTKAPKCKKEAFSQIQKAVSGWKKFMTMWVDGKMRQTRNVNKNMYENMKILDGDINPPQSTDLLLCFRLHCSSMNAHNLDKIGTFREQTSTCILLFIFSLCFPIRTNLEKISKKAPYNVTIFTHQDNTF